MQGISNYEISVEDIKMKKLLATLLSVLLICSVCSLVACNKKDDDIEGAITNYTETTTYDIKDASGKVLGTLSYKAKGTDYAIITGYTSRISGAHSLIIPEVLPGSERTVVEIGNEAFKDCASLSSVKLPETVEKIGNGAFNRCSSIYKINIPANVASIGMYAFAGCDSLTIVNFAQEKPLLTEIGNSAFNGCAIESITIPEGVVSIGEGAFFECEQLKAVTLPESLTSIGKVAFAMCDALETVTLGSNIESLGKYALGTLATDKPEVLVYQAGSTTDETINNIVDEAPETDGE